MSKKNAMRAARNAMTSGYKHHSLDCMQQKLDAMIKGNEKVDYDEIDIHTYADVLAPTRFRGMKNGLICFVTIISRAAIKNGVENELSFALSDYYVNEIELQANEIKLNELKNEIIEIYVELVQKARSGGHSLQIMRAIRYMHLHIYERCSICAVAAHIGLNPQYFSVLFKKEMGMSPSKYMSRQRLEEANHLLQQTGMSITEISEALGYCNPSHFIREYRQFFGHTPKKFNTHQ